MTMNGMTLRPTVCELASTAAPPTEVMISPWGEVRSSQGNFVLDAEAGKAIIEAFQANQVDLPIDWEHQTLGGAYSSPDGKAPAAGWIKGLEVKPGVGLVARVSWTDEAAGQLTARKYRYLSPVLMVRKSDGRAVALHSVALTNKPAIVGMHPVVNSATATWPNVTHAAIANKAGAEYDQSPSWLHGMCDREAYVAQAVREAQATPRVRELAESLPDPTPADDRVTVIAKAAALWDGSPTTLQVLSDRSGFITGQLLACGRAKLSAEEAQRIDGILVIPHTEGDESDGVAARRLVSQADAPAADRRQEVIFAAVAEWKAIDERYRQSVSLDGYIDQGLRDAKLGPLTNEDQETVQLAQNPNARQIARNAAEEWDNNPVLQRLTTREAFIKQALHDGGMSSVTIRRGGTFDRHG